MSHQVGESFVQALLACQDRLHAYIMVLVLDPDQAADILQSTNLVLCKRADEFPNVDNFTAWACRIAYFEVLSHRKRQKRDRLVFDDDLLGLIAQEVPAYLEDVGQQERMLRDCLAELPESQRKIVLRRYGPGGSVKTIAHDLGRPLGSIHQALYRIRRMLAACVKRKMAHSAD